MSSTLRILRGFAGATILISILLLFINFIVGFMITVPQSSLSSTGLVKTVANKLEGSNGVYSLDTQVEKLLKHNHLWAMLVNNTGQVSWSYALPTEIPQTYSLTEVAKFSRSFLMDYPVLVWEHPDGLVVIGYPKDSYGKYYLSYPIDFVASIPLILVGLLIGNILLALLFSMLLGGRLIVPLKSLVNGIHALAHEQPVHIKPKGILSELAESLNHASDTLKAKNKMLKTRDEARFNWIAGISHDIRTPLSMILGYASDLEENPNLPQEQQKQAAIIRQQGVKLRELVKDLNLVSMLEYEMQPLVNKPMRLAPIARQVASDFLNNGLDEKYNIQLDIEDETVTVNGDEKLLTRALTNLVQNSITHNPQGCEIRIQIPQSNIAQQLCSIIVFDNGQGISQDQLSDLMELPYSDKRKHRRSNGHGLGIPIVTRIAKAHGGQLELFSDIQEGLTAIIYLPKNIESQVCSHK